MAYSYSGIKQFKNCPRQYHEVRVLKKWDSPPGEAAMYGKEVHEALELHIKDGKPLGPHARFQSIVEGLKELQGEKFTEMEMALDSKLQPCEFSSPDALIRGVADLVVINGDHARIVDYKTGKDKYADIEQLELMALMVFRYFPEVQEVDCALLFVLYDSVFPANYKRSQAREMWVSWAGKIEKIEQCSESGVWQENKTGLCNGWCPVKDCPHYKEKQYAKKS